MTCTNTGILQQNFQGSGTQASFQVSFPSIVEVGNQLLVAVEVSGVSDVPTVTDTLGNTWTQISHQTGGGGGSKAFTVFKSQSIGTGSCTLTFVLAGTYTWGLVGVALQDVRSIQLTSPENNSGNSAHWTSENITISDYNAILIAFDVAYSPPSYTQDNFIILQSIVVDTVELSMAYRLVTTGTYNSAWQAQSTGTEEWQTVLVGYPYVLWKPNGLGAGADNSVAGGNGGFMAIPQPPTGIKAETVPLEPENFGQFGCLEFTSTAVMLNTFKISNPGRSA